MSKNAGSRKIQNPTEKSNGFLWALLALLVVVVAVVAYVVVQGKAHQANKYADYDKESVSFTGSVTDSAIVLKAVNAKKDAKKIDFYEDFSCPHCAELGEVTDGPMKKAIENGDIVVNLRILNFLDRDGDDGNSTKAGAAALAVAQSGDWETYWNYRALLMKEQKTIYGQWDDNEFADVAKSLGAADEVAQKIREGGAKEDFRKFAEANSKKLEKDGGSVSSPRVFIDGKEVKNGIETWVEQATS